MFAGGRRWCTPGSPGGHIFAIFMTMEPMDIRRLRASKLELCPARDYFAGVTRCGAVFTVMLPSSFEGVHRESLIVEPYGELPELDGCVEDPARFIGAFRTAVGEYVRACVDGWGRTRWPFCRAATEDYNIYRESDNPYRPGQTYRAVLWTGIGDFGEYRFYFMPARGVDRKAAGADREPRDAFMAPEWISNDMARKAGIVWVPGAGHGRG